MKLYDVRFFDKSDKQWYYLDEARNMSYKEAIEYYSQLSSFGAVNGYYFIFPSETKLNFMEDFMENITYVERCCEE